jgi:hypothetical protein
LRAGLLLALLLAAAYMSFPWWAPRQLLARKAQEMLSRRLGAPVEIGKMELSWGGGLVLEDLRLGSDQEFGGGEMVHLRRLQCDLSPLHYLWTGQIEWAQLDSARIHAVVSPEGKLNLASLQRLTTGRDKIPHRLSVRSASIELELPRHDRLLRLNVSDLEYLSGRLEHVGRLTMSAGLIQQGGEAPVTLLASSSEQGPVVAGCSFRFSGIDLQQLNLPLLLGLSLKQFRGTGSGQLDCQLDQTGLVDNFSLALWVKDLDVQPVMGPSLPVVDLAEISLQASYDPLAETGGASSLNVTGFRVRVPGVDLAGRGRMSLARLLGGGWEAVTNLDVSGQVNPRAVATLLSGGPAPLPGGLDVDGSVLVGLTLRGDEKQSSMALTADATAAAISLSGRTLKPARRPLTVNFSGNLEKLTWQFSADKAQLQLGENRFASAGAMQNIRSVLGAWDKAGRTGGFRWVMRALALLDWHGSWEINELDSLGDLLGPAMPKDVRLAGKCEGQWAIQQAGGLAVSAQFALPPGTQLEWGNQFQKPVELPMEVQLSGQVSPDVLSLSQGRLRLLVGQAAASLEDVCIAFTEDASSAQAMPLLLPILSLPTVATGSGVFRLADLRTLSRCLPGLAKLEGKLTGTVTGRFDALAGAGARRLHLQIAASQSGLDLGPFFVKSPGEPAAIEMDLLADQKMEAQRRNRLSLEARLGSCTMHAALLYPSAGLADGFDFRGELSVADAQRFIRQAPMLEQALAAWEPRGSLDTEVQLQRNGQDYEGSLVCQADRLTFRRPGIGGAKASGVPLRLRLCGQATEKSARLSELAVCLGNSNFRAQGQVQLRPFQPLPAGQYWPPPGVAGADLEFISRVVLAPEATLPALFPELGLQILRSGLEGTIGVRGRLSGSANGLDVEIAADGTDLAVSLPDAYRKPAGAKALADISMYFPPDLAQFSCRGFSLRTDAFEISGDARWPFLKASPAEAHLAVSVADARALCRYFPGIALYSPSGKLLLDTQYQRSGRQAGRLLYATLTASDLGLQLAGKSVSLNGTVTAGDVGLADDIGDCTIGRLATGLSDRTGGGAGAEAGALEFAVGQTHGYILADLPRTCGTLVGKVDMHMGLLDGVELDQWLSQLKEPGLGQKTASAPARQTPPGLTAQRLAVLASQAASGIRYVRSHQAGMDLQLSLSIDRLRSLDPSTQTMFEPQAMLLKAQARDGQYNVAYACGLNGGTLERTYVADLRQDNPRVQTRTQLREAMMDKNLQLQLNQDFPGNNVSGKLSRQEELSFGLQDVAMNLLDSRYRPAPVGIARTITEDGVLIGRGAPKWMSNVFHGLDLMTYHYNTMTGTAQFNPDGSASNEMIFDGSSYNIYIRGSTDAKRIGRYEIGVLLGAARAPVLNFQARIEDGRFYDEEVSYPFPTETAYKFFLRNIAEGLHLGTERPSDKPIPPIKTASMPAN